MESRPAAPPELVQVMLWLLPAYHVLPVEGAVTVITGGGVNSSAPMSGPLGAIPVLRMSPSKSVGNPAMTRPRPMQGEVSLPKCRSVVFTKPGSALMPFTSWPVPCQPLNV